MCGGRCCGGGHFFSNKIVLVGMKRIYISGRISGLEFAEYSKRFGEVEVMLVERGLEVVNPVKIKPDCKAPEYKDFMLADLAELWDCGAIYMLANWRESRGARIEHAVAIELGMEVYYEGVNDVRVVGEN